MMPPVCIALPIADCVLLPLLLCVTFDDIDALDVARAEPARL